jgi:GNAT superfamily N-acetyltransferase
MQQILDLRVGAARGLAPESQMGLRRRDPPTRPPSVMPCLIRPFQAQDAPLVSALVAAYMAELFGGANVMTPERLIAGCGRYFELTVAEDTAEVVGFAAWRETYDLHNDVLGGEIADFFVTPSRRGRGVAVQLVAGAAGEIKRRGGMFLCSLVLQDDPARVKLARRWGVGFAGEHTYLAEAVFHRMADWGGAGNTRGAMRELLTMRPKTGRPREARP